ncbi:hypothetical protein [Actinomadura rupiterrae]|uniref:hypothetical protein n=1 Tax=Actinomadura rupiterrae TaxID=559627 RepID=UPI0020A55C0F|nr:hypothetical protein [Actinomadura rupiterrae]MCP2336491.1 hypothetical protein [Actinomadura rupiterrae]
MRTVVRWVAAVTVVGAALGGCSSGKSKGGPDVPDKGTIVVHDNSEHPGQFVKFKDAEYVKVAGLPDKAAEQRIGQAFHGPLDWTVKWLGATLDADRKNQCKGKTSIVQTKVRLGLGGPDIVSANNSIIMIPCYESEEALPTVPVTVDVKAGKALTAPDVLTDKTLNDPKPLWDALSGPKDDWKQCELADIKRKDFLPGKQDGPVETPPSAGLFFDKQGLNLIWSTIGTDCSSFTFSAPYAKLKDLVKPDLLTRLQTAATAK